MTRHNPRSMFKILKTNCSQNIFITHITHKYYQQYNLLLCGKTIYSKHNESLNIYSMHNLFFKS